VVGGLLHSALSRRLSQVPRPRGRRPEGH
jgi:hypothetical protein